LAGLEDEMLGLRLVAMALGCLASGTMAVAQSNDETRLKVLGQHLARECVTCHRLDGVDNGIPAIVGWKVEDFVDTMGFYKGEQRQNAAMRSVAQSLDDEQTKALALWFAAQPPPAKTAPAPAPSKKK
jgi:cytochrome c553